MIREGYEGKLRTKIAEKLHLSESSVHRYECLLRLSPSIQELVDEGVLSLSAANLLDGESVAKQDLVSQYIKDSGEKRYSTRKVQKLIEKIDEQKEDQGREISGSSRRDIEKARDNVLRAKKFLEKEDPGGLDDRCDKIYNTIDNVRSLCRQLMVEHFE